MPAAGSASYNVRILECKEKAKLLEIASDKNHQIPEQPDNIEKDRILERPKQFLILFWGLLVIIVV